MTNASIPTANRKKLGISALVRLSGGRGTRPIFGKNWRSFSRASAGAATGQAMNGENANPSDQRVVHVTHHKCGSQWVRDILTAPEIVGHTRMPHSGVTFDLARHEQVALPSGKVSGPIYNVSHWDWKQWRRAGDRVIVVIRDPRDTTVSSLYSSLYSHGADTYVEAVRKLLAALPSDEERLVCAIREFAAGARAFRTWAESQDSSALVVKYEALIGDQVNEFRRIFDWLEWDIPPATLSAVVERMDFKHRSGRSPGTVDIYSHLRKGVAGDWRTHFTRRTGQIWEAVYPGLLRAADYEAGNDWWQVLPEKVEPFSGSTENAQYIATDIHLTKTLKKRNEFLEEAIQEKERVIAELSEECRKRMDLIDSQAAQLEKLIADNQAKHAVMSLLQIHASAADARNEQLQRAIEEKEQYLSRMSAMLTAKESIINALKATCDERLDLIEQLNAAMQTSQPDSFLTGVKGVIHVGASYGQERDLYAQHGLGVLWVEPIPEVFAQLVENLSAFPLQQALECLVTDRDGAEYEFNISNNEGMSSSILDLKLHRDIWPEVHYDRAIRLISKTLPTALADAHIDIASYDALIMDTQGSELLILQGAAPVLEHFRYIKTEAPDFEAYEGCCLVEDLARFLAPYGFVERSRHKFAERAQGGSYFDVVFEKRP